MKRLYTILLLLIGIGLHAQNYNNEWIDFSKTYYKFKIAADGLCRIPQSLLATAGLGSVPAQSFQLFRNGEEVPLYTTVASGPLGSSDYIEFWGRMNDGVPDAPLYRSPAYQHTKKWSLESDTAFYYLTVNTTATPFHFNNAGNDTTGNTLPVEPYFMNKSGTYFRTGGINPGFAANVGEYIYSSSYDIGEWWSSPDIAPGGPLVDVQSNLFVYSGGPSATLSYGMAGTADDLRRVQVSVNNTVMVDSEMDSFYDLKGTVSVPVSLISAGTASVQFINNSATGSDLMRASFYEFNYPRQFNFGGQSNYYFELAARSAGYFLKINNFNVLGGTPPILYDLTSGGRYTAIVGAGNVLSFLLPGSTATRKFVLVNEDPSKVTTVAGLATKNFVNFTNPGLQGNYLIISNPILYAGVGSDNPILDYKVYRSTAAGGSWDAQVYDINELVDQFAFGIKKHPLSIQNFLRYARNVFAVKPQYVFLIGHGMVYSDYQIYSEQRKNPVADQLDLVPTFGNPASDNKLSAGNPVDAVAVTPIGRLSVVSAAEVTTYLAKVKEYEMAQSTSSNTIDGRLWMKNMVHITGASEPYLGTILCNYMTSYQQIISDTLFGANVASFCKTTADQVQQVTASSLTSLFNTGLSILTYFGHSSSTTLGYNLDDPSGYDNPGKYPVFFVDGCDAGDFFVFDPQRFTTNLTLSETYVLAKERGAIAFVASTHFGIVNYLNIYLSNLYNGLSVTDYGKSLGIAQKDALQALMNAAPGDFYARLHAEEMTTHGDPALKFNTESLPDYDIEASQVQINPTFVAVSNNNFTVTAHLYNLGKAVSDSISVTFTRKFPNGTSAVIMKRRIAGIRYDDTLQLIVPIVATRDKGQNYITVVVNSDNNVPEVTLANNSATAGVYIYQEEANPAYPFNYGIINTPVQPLYASTADPLSASGQYAVQIDTTALFNSSQKVAGTITSVGGVLEFDPHISYKDSVVYYWRISVVPKPDSPYNWNNSSFIYIDSITSKGGGYNQSHFYQHTQSTMDSIYLDSASRIWKYSAVTDNITAFVGIYPTASADQSNYTVSINGDPLIGPGCNINEVIINVIDPITFTPWQNVFSGGSGLYNSENSNCGSQRQYGFNFLYSDSASRKHAMDFLNNIVPNGAYVVIRTNVSPTSSANVYVDKWMADTARYGPGNSLYNVMVNAGCAILDSFTTPRALAFIYQKGTPSFTPRYKMTIGIYDNPSLSVNCQSLSSLGYVTSPQFGPAKQWKQLHWRGSSLESPSTDNVSLNVYGVDTSGNSTLITTLPVTTQDYDISAINASKFPYVQLKLMTQDTVHGTPYQLRYWRVTDNPVPEGALASNVYLKNQDTLQIGQPLNFGIAFKNISPTAFSDSMTFNMTVTDKNNASHTVTLPKGKVLVSGDTLSVNYQMDTKNYPGLNTLYLNVNPHYAQPEQYLFNNFLYKNFYVMYDTRNPLLDVTFDNVHILNGDIVSTRPHIQIKLKSPSQFLLLSDTSLISVQVLYPDGSLHSYSYSSDTLRFTPATSSNNTATVDFTPSFINQINPTGDNYQLIVTGKDESGNLAGAAPYRVGFKIITKAMISNIMNYPNPFSTSTAFVFTVTGTDVPQDIKIQILTITGKIVREITKEELGPLHVGTNITQFKWNGTDMYGSRLANGVYLYHVVTNLNGHSLDKYQAAGDNTNMYFNNGYGKMYLMR